MQWPTSDQLRFESRLNAALAFGLSAFIVPSGVILTLAGSNVRDHPSNCESRVPMVIAMNVGGDYDCRQGG